jgi:signal recognition particle receptor subunit beta
MVFFNYSTMQMAAKIVYYGPGLCGKTTNLQYIYNRTSDDSRGEMVSLETETDRTLFFDLLPIDVGSIAGFNTRIQLYTVPGQVFYNTTRKLVLKGVDGVVFVADSQKPMLQANRDSFQNLEENLQEMGLTVKEIPLVLQFNKRDLPDICSVEELSAALNPDGRWHHFESSAINGQGVFETLKGVSKLTLMSLKQRLSRSDTPKPAARPTKAPQVAKEAVGTSPQAASRGSGAPAVQRSKAASAAAGDLAKKKSKTRDVMGELEKLHLEHSRPGGRKKPEVPASQNGRNEVRRNVELTLKRADFVRVRRFLVTLQVEDADSQVVESVQGLRVEVSDPADFQKLLLRLNVALNARE